MVGTSGEEDELLELLLLELLLEKELEEELEELELELLLEEDELGHTVDTFPDHPDC